MLLFFLRRFSIFVYYSKKNGMKMNWNGDDEDDNSHHHHYYTKNCRKSIKRIYYLHTIQYHIVLRHRLTNGKPEIQGDQMYATYSQIMKVLKPIRTYKHVVCFRCCAQQISYHTNLGQFFFVHTLQSSSVFSFILLTYPSALILSPNWCFWCKFENVSHLHSRFRVAATHDFDIRVFSHYTGCKQNVFSSWAWAFNF